MGKHFRPSTWGSWVAGALAALIIAAPYYWSWPDQQARTPPGEETDARNKPIDAEPPRATAGNPSLQKPEIQSFELGTPEVDAPEDEAPSSFIDPAEVYTALQSPNTEERYEALETAARFPDTLYDYDAVYLRIVALCSDQDKQVAERAQFARFRLKDLRARHEIPEPSDRSRDAVEPFETLQKKALDDPDSAVRMGGIESAMSQRDEQAFELLSQAVRGDYDEDNRMTAVSEVEQMLKSSIGDREQILTLLQETVADPDPRIAELSQLIIREQFGQDNLQR